jgi:hypothetical protein
MNINYSKIDEIYGTDILEQIKNNFDDVSKNVMYLVKLNIEDVDDIFERYAIIFICNNKEYINKVNKLINKLGENYIEILGMDMSLWEELV